jgi:hypothetical protein
MDSIARFWLNPGQTISTKLILKRAENNTLWRMAARMNVARQLLQEWSRQASALLRLTYRRKDSFQGVEALFITQGRDLNQCESNRVGTDKF